MSNLPISSKYVSAPNRMVDARERETVVDRVNAAFEAGSIDDLDYRRYLDIAFSAKTLGDLRPVVEHLPAQATYATPGNIEASAARPGDLTESRAPNMRLILVALTTVAACAVLLVVVLALFG